MREEKDIKEEIKKLNKFIDSKFGKHYVYQRRKTRERLEELKIELERINGNCITN